MQKKKILLIISLALLLFLIITGMRFIRKRADFRPHLGTKISSLTPVARGASRPDSFSRDGNE